MKKTLYFDKETIDILEQMPQKKQSDYARKAVKDYHYRTKAPEIKQESPKTIPKIEVKWHYGKN